jgi:hypothetical protein
MRRREAAKTVMEPIRWFKTITMPSQTPIAQGGALQSCCALMATSPGDRRNPRQLGWFPGSLVRLLGKTR